MKLELDSKANSVHPGDGRAPLMPPLSPVPEQVFFAWLCTRPDLAPRLLALLPRECLSQTGQIWAATVRQCGQFPPDLPASDSTTAIAFVRDQLCFYLGREAGRAQRNGTYQRLLDASELLSHAMASFEALPLDAYTEIIPILREFIPTGVAPLDEQIGGLARGELGIIGMSPGKGKSHLLINFAVSALRAGRSVHYLTIADAGVHELVPRVDTCLLGVPPPRSMSQIELQRRHTEAQRTVPGLLWISDFTDRECRLSDVEQVIRECQSDLVLVDHADDVLSAWSQDPTVTRHSLRVVYTALKRLAVQYHVPVWTASQTPEFAWHLRSAGISELSEAKVGKATGAALVLMFSEGPSAEAMPGVVWCTIAKARRWYTSRSVQLHFDYPSVRTW